MSAKTILLITHSEDRPADWVEQALEKRGHRAVRLDTDLFPHAITLVLRQKGGRAPSFILQTALGDVDVSSVHAVWYRRFYTAKLPAELDAKYVGYGQSESRTLLSALFAALEHVRWIDPIHRVHRAHHKVLQLEAAKRAGFTIPDTLSTNDPESARAFFTQHGGNVVTKMLNAITLKADGTEQMVFTSRVRQEDLAALDGLKYCPAVFQEIVPKAAELRVAVVGRRLFVASVDSSASDAGNIDWRRDGNLATQFVADSIPQAVQDAVFRLMEFYGLTYGSLDIIRRPDGEHVFLEINSAGEWAWLAQTLDFPIADALADELLA